LAILTVAGYQLCFFAAVARTGVAVGTVVAISSAPVVAGLLGLLAFDARPGRRWAAATGLAIAGCLLLTLADASAGAVQVDPLGILLAVGTGASYAIYTLALKRLLAFQTPDAVTAVAFSGGALLLMPLLFFVDLRWLTEPRGLLVALHIGLIATALAYLCFIRGLVTVPAASAVTLALAEPLTATLLGMLVLGERLRGPALLGMALLALGLGVLAWPRREGPDAE
jgi:DME family drug/metabolite transporter